MTQDELVQMLVAFELDVTRTGTHEATVRLPSTARGILGVHLTIDERSVHLQAFVLRNPDRGREAIYGRLLRRHFDRTRWRFAIDDVGDIYLTHREPLDAFSDRVDGLLGELVMIVDEVYAGVLETGFETTPAGRPS
jgi:hypothetical protein